MVGKVKPKAQSLSDPKLGVLEFAPPQSLKPWPENPRKNENAIPKVRASIAAFGFGAPVVARLANREIIAGHTRWQAALDLKLDLIPVRLLDVDEATAHALALADNKTGEIAEWDEAKLKAELDKLQEVGQDPGDMGFVEEDLAKLAKLGEELAGEAGAKGKTPGDKAEGFAAASVRQVVLIYDEAEYEEVVRNLEGVCKAQGFQTNTEAVTWLCRKWSAGECTCTVQPCAHVTGSEIAGG